MGLEGKGGAIEPTDGGQIGTDQVAMEKSSLEERNSKILAQTGGVEVNAKRPRWPRRQEALFIQVLFVRSNSLFFSFSFSIRGE